MAPTQSCSGCLRKCSGSFLGRYNRHPWLGFAGQALGGAFGCGPQAAQRRRKVSCWALPSPRAPSSVWLPPSQVPTPWEHWRTGLVWDACSTRGSCRPHEAAKHKSLFFPSSLTPCSLKNHPWAPQPPQLSQDWVSSQTKLAAGLRGQSEACTHTICHGDEL